MSELGARNLSELEERIKKRQRAKVKSRGSVVENLMGGESKSEELLTQTSETPTPTEINPSTISSKTTKKVREDYKNFSLSQATLRFEQDIAERLQKICINQKGSGKISREALIEAMFLDLEADPERLQRVLEIAKERTALRKRAANWRRGKTMTRNAEFDR